VVQALQARGFSVASGGAEPEYVIEVAASARPIGVAAAVPNEQKSAPLLPAAGRTLRQPLARGAATLAVRIVEQASGRELYAASATRTSRRPAVEPYWVEAALAPLGSARP